MSSGTPLHPHEEALIRAFMIRERREQFLMRIQNAKTRRKVLGKLYHFHDLDPRYAHRMVPSEATPEGIYDALRGKGAPSACHVVSADSDLDGRDMDLRDALQEVVNHGGGTFLSCIPGKLGYFEGEESNERYILER